LGFLGLSFKYSQMGVDGYIWRWI